jgi:hypothetical protein
MLVLQSCSNKASNTELVLLLSLRNVGYLNWKLSLKNGNKSVLFKRLCNLALRV